MSQIVSFEDFTPAARYDAIPWESVTIEEAAAYTGPWTLIDTLTFTPDIDPEHPAERDFTTENASDDADLWYRLTFYDGNGDHGLPSVPIQNTEAARVVYATVEELAEILRVRVPDRRAALARVLEAAATEIDAELDRATPFGAPPALVTEVNLERAVEHWQQMQSPFGIIGLTAETGPTHTARDSWDRHAHKLAPLKESWGLA